MTTRTQADIIRRCEGKGVNMLDALERLAKLCKEADEILGDISALAEACDIGYRTYNVIPGGYFAGVTSNVDSIRMEAERLIKTRS